MMPRSRWAFLVVTAVVFAMSFGCSAFMGGNGERRTNWETAFNENNAPTKIKYSFGVAFDRSGYQFNYVYLYNGYDKPLKIYYKIYFSAREPLFGDHYLYTKKETMVLGMVHWEPAKVVIIKLVEQ